MITGTVTGTAWQPASEPEPESRGGHCHGDRRSDSEPPPRRPALAGPGLTRSNSLFSIDPNCDRYNKYILINRIEPRATVSDQGKLGAWKLVVRTREEMERAEVGVER
eukprot:2163128-Rhodomonas_salina.1